MQQDSERHTSPQNLINHWSGQKRAISLSQVSMNLAGNTITIKFPSLSKSPFNASATIVLPDAEIGAVSVNGEALNTGEETADGVTVMCKAGTYTFVYPV